MWNKKYFSVGRDPILSQGYISFSNFNSEGGGLGPVTTSISLAHFCYYSILVLNFLQNVSWENFPNKEDFNNLKQTVHR